MGMDVHSKDRSLYFRASVWSWRPLHLLCEEANITHNLGLDMSGWAYNDGNGLDSPKDCKKLADALHDVLKSHDDLITLDSDPHCGEGMVLAFLEKIGCPFGVGLEGSYYGITKQQAEEFVEFLRKANGFEIW